MAQATWLNRERQPGGSRKRTSQADSQWQRGGIWHGVPKVFLVCWDQAPLARGCQLLQLPTAPAAPDISSLLTALPPVPFPQHYSQFPSHSTTHSSLPTTLPPIHCPHQTTMPEIFCPLKAIWAARCVFIYHCPSYLYLFTIVPAMCVYLPLSQLLSPLHSRFGMLMEMCANASFC